MYRNLLSIVAACMLSACVAAPAFAEQAKCVDHLSIVGKSAQASLAHFGSVPTLVIIGERDMPVLLATLAVSGISDLGGLHSILTSDRAEVLQHDAAESNDIIFSRNGCFTGVAVVPTPLVRSTLLYLARTRT